MAGLARWNGLYRPCRAEFTIGYRFYNERIARNRGHVMDWQGHLERLRQLGVEAIED